MPEKQGYLRNHPVLINFLLTTASVEFVRMSLVFTFLPSFFNSQNYEKSLLGIVLSACLLADNLLKSTAGWLVDRYGPWPVLLIGSGCVLFGISIFIFFYKTLFLLIMAGIFIGLGVSPTWPAAIAGSLKIGGEEKKATIISIISVVWLAGGGLGPVLMGFLIDAGNAKFDGYFAGLLIMFLMSVLAIINNLVGGFLWKRIKDNNPNSNEEQKNKQKINEIFRRLWMVKGLLPGMFFQTISLGILIPNLLPYAVNQLRLSESQYSILLIIGGLVVITFMIPVGHLVDKWGAKGFLVSGFLLASVGLFLLVRFANVGNIWYIAAFTGLSYSLIQPAWNSLLAGCIPPEQRGVLMGLFMSVEGIGFAFGPLVGGYLSMIKNSGPGIPFYVSSAALLVMAFVYLMYPFHQYHFKEF